MIITTGKKWGRQWNKGGNNSEDRGNDDNDERTQSG